MVTDNVIVFEKLINGLIRIVKHWDPEIRDMRSKSPFSAIYVKCDDSKSGKLLKDRRLCPDLKECLPMTTRTTSFSLKTGKSTVIVEIKRSLRILGHAITDHKSLKEVLRILYKAT